MADTFLKSLDHAVRRRCFDEFKDYLGLTDYVKDSGFVPKDVAMRDIAEERGKVSVEFISVFRKGIDLDLKRQNTHLARRGIAVVYTEDSRNNALMVKAQPCLLHYELFFWSRDPDKLSAIDIAYLFWEHRDPNINVDLVIGDTLFPLEIDMIFQGISDESTTEMKYDKGLYFCHSARFDVEGWVFDHTTDKVIQKIFLKGYDRELYEDILLFEKTIEG